MVISHVTDSQITVTMGGDGPRSVGLRPGWWDLPPGLGRVSLATLLKADLGMVPFVDVGGRLNGLAAWAAGEDPIAAAVVAGSAGRGKTRLGGQLCRVLTAQREEAWLAGFVRRDAQPDEIETLAATHVPRCVVIDYSEAKADAAANLVSRLVAGATVAAPVRVVLLTRATIGGSHDVRVLLHGRSTAFDVLLDNAEAHELALSQWSEPETRRALFTAAAGRIADWLGLDPPKVPEQLEAGVYDRPLTIAVAAGLACLDERTLPTERTELLDRLLEVEAQHWRRTADRLRVANASDSLLRTLAGYATLAGAASDTEAGELLARLPVLADAPRERRYALAEWMHAAYPGTRYWNPVEPDLIGEHLVATSIGDQGNVVEATLSDRRPAALQQPLELLARAMSNYPDHAATWRNLVDRRFVLLVEATRDQAAATTAEELFQPSLAGTLALALTQVDLDLDSLAAAAGRIAFTSIVLNPLQTAIDEQLVTRYRDRVGEDPAAYLPDLAGSLSRLSFRLADAGRRDEALSAIEEAVAIRRRLAEDNPVLHLPDLAGSLNDLSVRLADVGRRDEALVAIEEAVAVRRRLTDDDPPPNMPYLAGSLKNLSNRLAEAGRRDEVLTAIKEAVRVYRRLAEDNPALHLPDLAGSLNNLSVHLADVGRRDEVLAAIEEAVAIRRRLAEDNPAAYLPDLAGSLNNLSNRLADVGRRDEGLAAIEEAVTLARRLTDAEPAAYLPDLAGSLNNLSNRLADVGRREEALTAIEEAVAIRRQLEDNPAAYLPDLAGSLQNLSNRLADVGRRDEVLPAIEEAVAIRRRLADANPAAYLPARAGSLNDLSVRLADVGRRDEALSTIEEAVAIHRRLADAEPAAYLPALARSLNNRSLWLAGVGRRDDALSAIEEAVAIRRRLADANPAAYLPELAASLTNLSNRLGDLGREEDARRASEEAQELRRHLE